MFMRMRDAKKFSAKFHLERLFDFCMDMSLSAGVSGEASLPAVEILELIFGLFGPYEYKVAASKTYKGCGIGESLGFFSEKNIFKILSMGLSGQ